MEDKLLKSVAINMEATIRVGKNGITDQILEETKNQLKKRKIVKIKLLKSFTAEHDRKAAFDELIKKTESKLIHKIGGTIVLYKNFKIKPKKPRKSA